MRGIFPVLKMESFVSESSSAININNKSSGVIKGKTGINAQTGAGINNAVQ